MPAMPDTRLTKTTVSHSTSSTCAFFGSSGLPLRLWRTSGGCSPRVGTGTPIFPEVIHRLRHTGGMDGYRLFALASRSGARSLHDGLNPEDFLVKAEAHGVPQARHRVFVICVRADVAGELAEEHLPRLEPEPDPVPLGDIIGAMPRLRSRLSKGDDPGSWQDAVRAAHAFNAANQPAMSNNEKAPVPKGSCPRSRYGKRVRAAGSQCEWQHVSARGLPSRSP